MDTKKSGEYLDLLEKKKIGLDDRFTFQCKGCGKCCRNLYDLALVPYDIYRIAKYLGRSMWEILERYTEHNLGGNSHLPVISPKLLPPYNACLFKEVRNALYTELSLPPARISLSEEFGLKTSRNLYCRIPTVASKTRKM